MTKQRKSTVKFYDILEKLPEIEGKTLQEVTDILGFTDTNSARIALYKNKKNGKLFFNYKGGVYQDFESLDERLRSNIDLAENEQVGKHFMLEKYFAQIIALDAIISNQTAKNNDKIKAIDLQQKALRQFSYIDYKQFVELAAQADE